MKIFKILPLLLFIGLSRMATAQEMPPSLQEALKIDDTVKISHYVTKDNINRCFGNYSLLAQSIRSYAPKCFDLLIARGADVNVSCNGYVPPLMHAAEYGHLDMVKVLLEKGADLNYVYNGPIESKKGQTPITYAEFYKHPEVADYLRSIKK